jgi:hypothetical protein
MSVRSQGTNSGVCASPYRLGQFRAGIGLDVEKRDARLVRGKGADERSANAAGAAGHDDSAALETLVAGKGH